MSHIVFISSRQTVNLSGFGRFQHHQRLYLFLKRFGKLNQLTLQLKSCFNDSGYTDKPIKQEQASPNQKTSRSSLLLSFVKSAMIVSQYFFTQFSINKPQLSLVYPKINRSIEYSTFGLTENRQIYLAEQQAMYSSRPNPIIKFYSRNKRPIEVQSGREYSFLELKCLDIDFIQPPTNYLEEHRKRIIMDYQKKLTEIKSIKNKFDNDISRTSRTQNLSFRAKTSRQPITRSKKSKSLESARLFISTQAVQNTNPERSPKQKILNLSRIRHTKQEQISAQKPLTTFQKSTLKRLRAREQVILKKKFISFNIDQKHQKNVSPKKPAAFIDSFRAFTECPCQ